MIRCLHPHCPGFAASADEHACALRSWRSMAYVGSVTLDPMSGTRATLLFCGAPFGVLEWGGTGEFEGWYLTMTQRHGGSTYGPAPASDLGDLMLRALEAAGVLDTYDAEHDDDQWNLGVAGPSWSRS